MPRERCIARSSGEDSRRPGRRKLAGSCSERRPRGARRLSGVQVHECWRAPGTVELRANAQAPVWRLPVIEPLDAFYWRADFSLVPGRVIHDYLAAGTSPT